jgi:peptidoglycan/LPS O-acetylase OafA/YrhL
MGRHTLPRLSFQRHRQLGDDCWHSVLISVLRGLAALAVACGHLRSEMYPAVREVAQPALWFKGFAFFTGFGHQAVMVFFIISGWLVGGSLLDKMGRPGAVADYAIDRATRLWTVLIPAFGLTLLFGLGTGALLPGGIDFSAANEFSALTFAGNLLGLQSVALANFGGNYALWSLANETWYYVLFPLLVLLFTTRRGLARIACGAALALLAAVLPLAIVLYFSVWLLGVAFSRVRIDCGAATRCGWLLLLVATSVYYRLTGSNDASNRAALWMDLVLGLMFLVMLSSLQFKAPPQSALGRPLAKAGKFFADFSFSLYVLHVPLIVLLKHVAATRFGLRHLSPSAPLHFAIYLGMLAALLGAAYLSYLLFESQTYRVRRVVKDLVGRRGIAPPAKAPAVTPVEMLAVAPVEMLTEAQADALAEHEPKQPVRPRAAAPAERQLE